MTIDPTVVQGAVNVGKGERNHIGPQRLEDRFHHRIADRAYLEADQIRRTANRTFGIGELAKTIIGKAQKDDAVTLDLGAQRLADRAVEHFTDMRRIAEQKGEIQYPKLGRRRRNARRGEDGHIDGADLDALPEIDVAAARAAAPIVDDEAFGQTTLDLGDERIRGKQRRADADSGMSKA